MFCLVFCCAAACHLISECVAECVRNSAVTELGFDFLMQKAEANVPFAELRLHLDVVLDY